MFAEMLEEMQLMENRIMARFDRLDKTQAEQTAMIKEILAAVTLPPASFSVIRATIDGTEITKEGENIQMKTPVLATVSLSVEYFTDETKTKKARTDGPPVWSAEPPNAVTLTPSSNGKTCKVHTENVVTDDTPVVSVVITVSADGDQGEGVVPLISTALLDLFDPSSNAIIGEITVGEIVPDTTTQP